MNKIQLNESEKDGLEFEKQKRWEIVATLRSGEIRTFHVKSYQMALDMKESMLSQNDEYFGDTIESCEISKEMVEIEIIKFANGSTLELI